MRWPHWPRQPISNAACRFNDSSRPRMGSKTESELSRVIVDEAAVLVREVLSVWTGEYPVGVDSADDIAAAGPPLENPRCGVLGNVGIQESRFM